MVKILSIIPTLRDIPLRTLNSLLNQTQQPDKIIIVVGSQHLLKYLKTKTQQLLQVPAKLEVLYVRPNTREHVGVRVGKAINTALKNENLKLYDYILKVDSDVILHPKCLESCVKRNADLIGLGPFMLIKARPFMKFLSGKWPETPADDSYIRLLFIAKGLHVEFIPSCVTEVRRGGAYGTWRYYFYRGVDDYRTGINPISMSRIVAKLIIKRKTLLPIFTLTGYFTALITCKKRFDFAAIIFRVGLLGRILELLKRML